MGKRSDFERKPRDFYPTPIKAVYPLLKHLEDDFAFAEPCAGDGALVEHLETKGICMWASDIEPQRKDIWAYDYKDVSNDELRESKYIITNPPWDRKILHPMIEYFSEMLPTWFLFDADWMHTKQSIPFLPRLKKVVSVGRVKWIEDSKSTGKDNCCWYLFGKADGEWPTHFFGRTQ